MLFGTVVYNSDTHFLSIGYGKLRDTELVELWTNHSLRIQPQIFGLLFLHIITPF